MRSPNWFITTAKAQKQGDLNKEGTTKGQENWIPLHAVDYEVVSPHDVASGHASGKRQHRPFVFSKVPGASTPQWWQALITNEILDKVVIERYEMQNAKLTKTLGFTLEKASVADWKLETLEEAAAGEARPSEYLLEQVSLYFQKITIEFAPAKTTAMDDWYTTA